MGLRVPLRSTEMVARACSTESLRGGHSRNSDRNAECVAPCDALLGLQGRYGAPSGRLIASAP